LSDVLLLTSAPGSSADILPSLGLLPHLVRLAPAEAAAVTGGPPADVMLIDARRDLMHAKGLVRQLRGAGLDLPILAVVAEGGWAAVTADWGADDVILHTAGPGEVDARLRLAIGRRTVATMAATEEIRAGDLVIDEASYLARLRGRTLDLTFKEFELLKFLAQHPARVFTRSQLLQEVWGYDYFGGTRTVDVHVRRLRAKLGVEYELLIGTVRNVGYRFVPSQGKTDARREPAAAGPRAAAGDQRRAAAESGAGAGADEPDAADEQRPGKYRPAGGNSRPAADGDTRSEASPANASS
jgi:DNA-binding response OmpR family regulator